VHVVALQKQRTSHGGFAYKTEHVTWGCPLLACILVFCLVDADSSGPLVV